MPEVFLRDDVAPYFPGDPVAAAWRMNGEVVRDVAVRQTLRIELGGRTFYLKRHRGVGIGEIVKNWLVGKRAVVGARNEFEACRHLAGVGLTAPTVAAFGEGAGAASSRSSFVLCDALIGYEDLETVTLEWLEVPPDPFVRRRLVIRIAEFARRFHAAGVVHRDFYLCHLLRHRDPCRPELAVLDLHRALIFRELPGSWRRRDLAALLFSSLDLPVSRLSWLRFVRVYTGRPLREVFAEEGRFWESVYQRALKLYEKGKRKGLSRGLFPGGRSTVDGGAEP